MAWPLLKKYGKYIGILVLGILGVVLYVMVTSWLRKRGSADNGAEHVEDLQGKLTEIRAKLTEADQQAAVEVATARSGEAKDKEELKRVVKMPNKVKRRKAMVDLYNRVGK